MNVWLVSPSPSVFSFGLLTMSLGEGEVRTGVLPRGDTLEVVTLSVLESDCIRTRGIFTLMPPELPFAVGFFVGASSDYSFACSSLGR